MLDIPVRTLMENLTALLHGVQQGMCLGFGEFIGCISAAFV